MMIHKDCLMCQGDLVVDRAREPNINKDLLYKKEPCNAAKAMISYYIKAREPKPWLTFRNKKK